MRPFLLLPVAIMVPIFAVLALQAITGDPLSAVLACLLLLIALGAWFAGPIVDGDRRRLGHLEAGSGEPVVVPFSRREGRR